MSLFCGRACLGEWDDEFYNNCECVGSRLGEELGTNEGIARDAGKMAAARVCGSAFKFSALLDAQNVHGHTNKLFSWCPPSTKR